MTRIYLKIGLVVVLAGGAIMTAKIFWPAGSARPAESKGTGPAGKQAKADPNGEAKPQAIAKRTGKPAGPREPRVSRQIQQYPEAERLYQMALHHRKPVSTPQDSFRILASCCQQIIMRYPNSPQAEKARGSPNAVFCVWGALRKLLREAGQEYYGVEE
jgi:hypothetical protein